MNDETDNERERRGIQSVEVGGQLLRALADHGGALPLKDLARAAGMPAAKAHPYLVSFGRIGLVEQEGASGRYALGPLALQLGLISLQQSDPVHLATPLLAPLAQQTGHTVAIAVWGSRGATIVRIEASPVPIHVSMRHGTVFSLTRTASGRLFGAYLPPETVQALLEEERRREKLDPPAPAPGRPPHPPLPAWDDFARQLDEVRAHGISHSEGEVVTGINAMSAPVFNATGEIVLGITAVGPVGTFDVEWDGALAQALKACARQVSERLGGRARPAGP